MPKDTHEKTKKLYRKQQTGRMTTSYINELFLHVRKCSGADA